MEVVLRWYVDEWIVCGWPVLSRVRIKVGRQLGCSAIIQGLTMSLMVFSLLVLEIWNQKCWNFLRSRNFTWSFRSVSEIDVSGTWWSWSVCLVAVLFHFPRFKYARGEQSTLELAWKEERDLTIYWVIGWVYLDLWFLMERRAGKESEKMMESLNDMFIMWEIASLIAYSSAESIEKWERRVAVTWVFSWMTAKLLYCVDLEPFMYSWK